MQKMVALLLVSFLLTVALVYVVRKYALRFLLDQPNQRSSHQLPTPRGGGLASVIVFVLANIYLFIEQRIGANILVLSGIGTGVAVIGFWDDHRSVSALWRFPAHVLAALLAMLSIQGLPAIALASETIEPGWIGYLLGTLFLTWMLNLFNFMDGIDGIAASEATFVTFALAAFMWRIDVNLAIPGLVLGMTCLGFLVWNWPPAKIFMGDVGSGFIGFMLAILILLYSRCDPVMFAVGLILFAVFVVDASYTLLRRLLSGQQWYAAHCLHAYQKAAKQFGGHLAVVKLTWLINLSYLLPLAGGAFYFPVYAWIFLLLAYIPLIFLAYQAGAGIES